MKQKEIIVPYDSLPQLHTGSFLAREQAEQFKDAFKNLVAVIRCKDCKYKEKDGISEGFHYCNINGLQVTDYWYCADGERKEKDNADE